MSSRYLIPFITSPGLFSRGRSHVARLAVAVHFLLSFWETYEADLTNSSSNQNRVENEQDNQAPADQSNMVEADEEEVIEDEDDEGDMPDSEEADFDSKEAAAYIGKEAVEIASSVVTTCLTQLCKYTFVN